MRFIEIQRLEQGSEQWQQWRETGVGGSDAPVIMMGNVYGKTPRELWRQKMGYAQARFTDAAQDHIDRGNSLEPEARKVFIERTGIAIEPVCLQSANHPFMLASLDGMNADRTVGVEIKAPAAAMYRKILDEGAPEMYRWQIQHQLAVSGAREFYFAAYSPDSTPDVYVERHEPNYAQIEELTRKIALFWRHVELNIPIGDDIGVDITNVGLMGLTMFAGYARVGKDVTGLTHQSLFKTRRYAFADPLKDAYCAMKNITREELNKTKEKHRKGLIQFGHGMRQIDPNVWVNGVFNMNSGIFNDIVSGGAIITDTRYVNEVSAGRAHAARLGMPFRLVWIERPHVGPIHETEAKTTSLLRSMADVILVNDMDTGTYVGRLATDMAVISTMSTIPDGKGRLIKASDYEKVASAEVKDESKRKASRRKTRI